MNTRSQSESYRLPCNAFTTRVHWALRARCRGRARTLYQRALRPLPSKARPVPPLPGRTALAGEPRQAHCLVTAVHWDGPRERTKILRSKGQCRLDLSSGVEHPRGGDNRVGKLGVCARLLAETVSASPVRIGRSVHLSLHPCDHSIEEDVLKEGYAPVRGLQEVRRRWGPPSSLFSRLRYSA